MLSAIRTSDLQKVIGDHIPKDKAEKYTCSFCKKEVLHHKGLVKIGHFKHRKGQAHCPNKGESYRHLQIKLAIYNYLKKSWATGFDNLEVEKWLFGNAMRPDIYIETKKGNRIALEIQTTPLTVEEILRRTANYTRQGIHLCWVLPYDFARFHEDKYDYKTNTVIKVPSKKIKLKAFELFLYHAYYKKLVFWEPGQKHGEHFTVIEFAEYYADDVYLIKKGEGRFFHGRKAKTLKTIKSIYYHVGFEQFKLTNANRFRPKDINYEIPYRKLFTYPG